MPDQILSYFIRHGTTALNESKSFRGKINPALDEKGMSDALELKSLFKNIDLGDAFSSDTLRAQTTAQTVLEKKGIDPIVTDQLRAWNVGYLSGKKKEGNENIIKYFQDNPTEKIPEGESLSGFRARVQPPIRHAIRRGLESGVPSIVFTHSSVLHELGNMLHGDHKAAIVKPGGVVAVKYDGKHFNAVPIIKHETDRSEYGT